MLRRFAQYLRLNQSLKKKAISASVYPIVLITAMMTRWWSCMLVYVIPQFQSFYEGLGAELPLPTRILMAIALTVRDNLAWILTGPDRAPGRLPGLAPAAGIDGRDRPRSLARARTSAG